ncbi:hypothetical protein ABIA32_002736 [Streptacidiphilus sp. MAP12-20]|uniref:hypothetical protein n=1 Tax=Streptacidiphilus sp. MAP12-20 TaxID=3156299 RepID=UPI0035196852
MTETNTVTLLTVLIAVIGFITWCRATAALSEAERQTNADVGLIEQRGEAITPEGPFAAQRLDTEQLLISPDQRAWEVDELEALWASSGDVQTDLRADPGPKPKPPEPS